jgi:hypothetical protein
LRQEFFNQKNYNPTLKNFEILSASDQNLSEKITKLESLLPNFSNQQKLSKSFSNLIPELLVANNNYSNSSLSAKILRNFSKMIIIRKIDGKDDGKIDSIISKVEKLLRQEAYQEALNLMLSLDQNYHEITANFLNDLTNAIEVQKVDQEILNYLKSLS